jgi:alanine dehydrogenase
VSADANVADKVRKIFFSADMVLKVKEPSPNEWMHLRDGQILFSSL